MRTISTFAQIIGAVLAAIGILGVFIRISSNDGALAVTGAILFGAGLVSKAVSDHGRDEKNTG